MRLESYVVGEMLQRMEQQGAALRAHAIEITAALSQDEYPAALEASGELHRVLGRFVANTEVLQDHVVAHDGMGEMGESLGELALRACASVVIAQLGVLSDALRQPAAQARARGWFVGRFRSITDVDAFVQDRLSKIHAMWLPYRQDQPQPPGMIDADRATLYRTMVRVAQRALRELRDEPELARFLESGVAAMDLPEIHIACKQVILVLGLELDAEPGRRTPRKPHRIVANNGASEKR